MEKKSQNKLTALTRELRDKFKRNSIKFPELESICTYILQAQRNPNKSTPRHILIWMIKTMISIMALRWDGQSDVSRNYLMFRFSILGEWIFEEQCLRFMPGFKILGITTSWGWELYGILEIEHRLVLCKTKSYITLIRKWKSSM